MIYPKVKALLAHTTWNQDQRGILHKVFQEQSTRKGFREDLIKTLCEKSAYHYGFREKTGHNTDQIAYTYRFGGSTFLDALREWVRECDAEFSDLKFLNELCAKYNQQTGNMVLVHNLGVVFCCGQAAQFVEDPAGFAEAYLDLRHPDRPPREKRLSLEKRMEGLSLRERWAVLWEQDDFKMLPRYLGQCSNWDADQLVTEFLRYRTPKHSRKWKKLVAYLRSSNDEGYKKIGRCLTVIENSHNQGEIHRDDTQHDR